MQSKKQRFAKKQTSALVLPQFVDQSVQHIHHLALPFWGQGFQSLGELCGVKQVIVCTCIMVNIQDAVHTVINHVINDFLYSVHPG